MSHNEPQKPGHETGRGDQGTGASKLPGMKTAAVAFVLTILLGAGGIAVANWNQSATATIDITTGAVPTPSPTPSPTVAPTPPPTVAPTPPPTAAPGSGNIVAKPAIMPLPAKVDAGTIKCARNGSSGNITISWPGNQTPGITYAVSLKSLSSQTAVYKSETLPQRSIDVVLENKGTAYGNYLFRIQAMDTATGVAGDPTYRRVRYFKDDFGCDFGASDEQPPLGAFAVNWQPMAPRPNDNVFKLSWTPSAATSYVVTIVLPAAAPQYGAALTTSELGATLIFPPRSWNQAGTDVADAAFFGEYTLRILPMNGTQAGDPIYKTVLYGPRNLTVW